MLSRRTWRVSLLKLAFVAFTLCAVILTARAEAVSVEVDQAKVVRLPERVSTIVIGNPLIADATLQAGGFLVVTGKGFGSTNLIALDRQGRVLFERSVQVGGPGNNDLVVVYRGSNRQSYSCTPDCSPRITLGDSTDYFNNVIQQSAMRNGMAAGAAGAAPK